MSTYCHCVAFLPFLVHFSLSVAFHCVLLLHVYFNSGGAFLLVAVVFLVHS